MGDDRTVRITTWANTNKHYDGVTFDESGNRIDVPGYQPTRMTDEAIEYLQSQKGSDRPFFLVVSWNPPHPPFDPPADDQAPYDATRWIERPNVRFQSRKTGSQTRIPSLPRKRPCKRPSRVTAPV